MPLVRGEAAKFWMLSLFGCAGDKAIAMADIQLIFVMPEFFNSSINHRKEIIC